MGLLITSPARVIIAVLSTAAASLGVVLYQSSRMSNYPDYEIHQFLPCAIAFSVAGAILLGYPKARTVAIVMLVSGVLASLALLASGLAIALESRGWWWAGLRPLQLVSDLTSIFGIYVALVLLPQVYPDGCLPERRWRMLLRFSIGLIGVVLVFTLVISRFDPNGEYTWPAWMGSIAVGFIISVSATLARWRHANAVMRQQIGWFSLVMLSTVVFVILAVFGFVPETWFNLLLMLWGPAVVAAIAAAVLQYQLFDIKLVLRRVVVHAVLAAGVAAAFIAVYFVLLAGLSERVIGDRYRWTGVVIATVLVVLAEPLRKRAQARLERRLLGERHEPLRALKRMLEATSEGGEQAVFDRIVYTIAAAVRSPAVSLELQQGGALVTVAATGDSRDPRPMALVHRGERLGQLRVDPRTPGEDFTTRDRAFLDQLVNQASALVYGLRRDAELAATRREALAATAEERSRLGRDLHDGLAPLLAGAGLSAEALRRGMPDGSPDEQSAAQLAARLRSAATELRRMAHDLQPAAMNDGIVNALRTYLASISGPAAPCWESDFDIGKLPAAVEQAAYLVTLEAVSNVLHHAQAGQMLVVLRSDDEQLVLRVEDDGVGLHAPYISGMGITSMRRRVEALGGTFDVGPTGTRGTRLTATFPL
jgi:signal transduction histidine kinase